MAVQSPDLDNAQAYVQVLDANKPVVENTFPDTNNTTDNAPISEAQRLEIMRIVNQYQGKTNIPPGIDIFKLQALAQSTNANPQEVNAVLLAAQSADNGEQGKEMFQNLMAITTAAAASAEMTSDITTSPVLFTSAANPLGAVEGISANNALLTQMMSQLSKNSVALAAAGIDPSKVSAADTAKTNGLAKNASVLDLSYLVAANALPAETLALAPARAEGMTRART